ncbi:F-box/LRR-repeat protein 13-like isoform X2 [Fopius arisanus]|nr:PREDICTED: F-box/LRR-repeat protein 13-like isoform X2 [Fopius arisanus]
MSCELSEKTLVHILKSCKNLQTLHIDTCRDCLMSGRLLDNVNDSKEISNNLKSLVELSLASNRYLSDALFNRLISICPNLRTLSLRDCQISFHPGIYKKFYPKNTLDQGSESVLTFFNILEYIKKQAKTLKHLDFDSTLIDNTALSSLVAVEDLQLYSLKLKCCNQLCDPGLRTLVHQKSLKILDLSFSVQVTDASLLYICQNLDNLESLNISKCMVVTDSGIYQIRRLKKLKELDISGCPLLSSAGVTDALCKYNPAESEDEKQIWDCANVHSNSALENIHQVEMKQDSFDENLEILSLQSLRLNEETIECIAASFKQLKYLDLGYCLNAYGVTDRTIQIIFKELTAIRTLKITKCDRVSDAGLTGMGAGAMDNPITRTPPSPFAMIQGITITRFGIRLGSMAEEEIASSSRKIDIPPGYSLLRLRGLRELDLSKCSNVTDVSLKNVFTFPELRVLNLGWCTQITHVGLDHLTRNNRAIEDLNLSGCIHVTDICIQYIVERLHRLKRLHLQECFEVTDHALDSIKMNGKSLQYLDVRSCKAITSVGLEGLLHRVHVEYSKQ